MLVVAVPPDIINYFTSTNMIMEEWRLQSCEARDLLNELTSRTLRTAAAAAHHQRDGDDICALRSVLDKARKVAKAFQDKGVSRTMLYAYMEGDMHARRTISELFLAASPQFGVADSPADAPSHMYSFSHGEWLRALADLKLIWDRDSIGVDVKHARLEQMVRKLAVIQSMLLDITDDEDLPLSHRRRLTSAAAAAAQYSRRAA